VGSEATALGVAESLPAVEGDKGGIGAEHGVIRQAEAGGAVEDLPAAAGTGPGLDLKKEFAIAGARFAASGGHQDQGTIGGQLQHRFGIGLAQLSKLLGSEAQANAERGRQVE